MLRSNGALGLSAILGLSLGCSPSAGAGGPGGVGGLGGASGLGGAGTSGTSGGGTAGDPGQAGSVSFGGDTFVIPDSGLTNHPPDAGCAGLTKQGEQLPLDIYIMFDQSASMSCAVGTGDRWSAVKSALSSFVQNQGASGIEVGLGYFGTAASPPGSSCKPEDYVPDVEISPLAVSAPAIVASLDAHNPLTDTPTLPAMESAITHAITWKAHYPSHTVVVVLVTDGEPNACGANTVAQVVGAADKGFAQGGIPTYVIGILSPGQTCALDPNQPNQADLDSVAKAGGTNAALIVDTTNATTDAGQQFLDTMNKIRQNAQIPCEYNIPPPPDGKTLAYDKTVNVGYRDPSGNPGKIYYVATKDQCDPSTGGGWYYDVDPSKGKPTKILLCPTTCTTVTSKFGYSVNIELNCPTEGPPR